MIGDLEEALAIETARTGSARGEATVVLRSLPRRSIERLPMRVRHPARAGGVALLFAAIIGAVVAFALTRTHGGTPPPTNVPPVPRERPVSLAQDAATQYNPFGTTPENPENAGLAIDGDPTTYWQTSTYVDGVLGKSGVGLYVDAAPGVAANRAVIQTSTPGFAAQVWGTDHVPPQRYSLVPRPGISPGALGWTMLGEAAYVHGKQRIPLSQVHRRRYYLLWITNLGSDPIGTPKFAQIAEFTLYRRVL
jgi:serine/threonine-protein kinase